MGMAAELSYVFYFISCCLTGSEPRTGNIHSIGTAVDSCDADLNISCRSKQFECFHRLE
jgi:hypothetical protein